MRYCENFSGFLRVQSKSLSLLPRCHEHASCRSCVLDESTALSPFLQKSNLQAAFSTLATFISSVDRGMKEKKIYRTAPVIREPDSPCTMCGCQVVIALVLNAERTASGLREPHPRSLFQESSLHSSLRSVHRHDKGIGQGYQENDILSSATDCLRPLCKLSRPSDMVLTQELKLHEFFGVLCVH